MNTMIKLLMAGTLTFGTLFGIGQINTMEKQPLTLVQASQTRKVITLSQAKKIALKKVNGTIKKAKLDGNEYDIEIQKGNYIYDIEINKYTGKIVDYDKEKVTVKKTKSSTKKVTLAQAKTIALKRVNGTIQKTRTNQEDYSIYIKKGVYLYEVEVSRKIGKITEIEKEKIKTKQSITLSQAKKLALQRINGKIIKTETDTDEYTITIEKGNYLYEIEIDRSSGKIKEIDKEKRQATKGISRAKAQQIALNKINGKIVSIEYDEEDHEYSVEIVKNHIEYEITISAQSGKVLEIEKD